MTKTLEFEMNWGDKVYVIIDDELREGEYRGKDEYLDIALIWMREKSKGQSRYKTYYCDDEVFTNKKEALKVLFKHRLSRSKRDD